MKGILNIRNIIVPIDHALTPNWKGPEQIMAKVQYEWLATGKGRLMNVEFREMQFVYLKDPITAGEAILSAIENNSRLRSEQLSHDQEALDAYHDAIGKPTITY